MELAERFSLTFSSPDNILTCRESQLIHLDCSEPLLPLESGSQMWTYPNPPLASRIVRQMSNKIIVSLQNHKNYLKVSFQNFSPGWQSVLGATDTLQYADSEPIASPLHPEPETALLSPSPENHKNNWNSSATQSFNEQIWRNESLTLTILMQSCSSLSTVCWSKMGSRGA